MTTEDFVCFPLSVLSVRQFFALVQSDFREAYFCVKYAKKVVLLEVPRLKDSAFDL